MAARSTKPLPPPTWTVFIDEPVSQFNPFLASALGVFPSMPLVHGTCVGMQNQCCLLRHLPRRIQLNRVRNPSEYLPRCVYFGSTSKTHLRVTGRVT